MDSTKIKRGLWTLYKDGYQLAVADSASQKTILFIFGCQRSGTTLMSDIFRRDLSTKIYPEHSKLSSRDERQLRLNPLPEVATMLNRERASLLVLKPLVETQNADKLLNYFDPATSESTEVRQGTFAHAKALWMYRHYKDVAASKLKKSGLQNGIRDMQHIMERSNSWRGENVPKDVREVIAKFYHVEMNPHDAAALYWYVRNSFLFELALDGDPRVMLCKYEDFVQAPAAKMQQIYQFLDRPLPLDGKLADVYATSIGKGAGVTISPPVAEVCDSMMERLDALYQQSAAHS